MRWKGRRQSTNIEDRRGAARAGGGFGLPRGGMRLPRGGMRLPRGGGVRLPSGGGRAAGGGGLLALVVVGLVLWAVAGINPLQLISILGGDGPAIETGAPYGTGTATAPPTTSPQEDELKAFVATVLADTEDVWGHLFAESGGSYREPTLVLFSGSVASACGFAGSASGPFYCPPDSRVYLDLAFFRELARRFGAPGDFAQAYVIAHEVGHHVQNELGVLGEANAARGRVDRETSNRISVRVELQADCFAGIWAHYAERAGLLEAGDVAEALEAARAVGDDTIQRRTQGYVVPESFSHGTGQQRQRWFTIGLERGDVAACDTFNATTL